MEIIKQIFDNRESDRDVQVKELTDKLAQQNQCIENLQDMQRLIIFDPEDSSLN
jgi:hypothetical protein